MLPFLLLARAFAQDPAPVERRLYADRVDASSFLWNNWNHFQENYHPNYAMDGDPATAWVEGASTDGTGEWLRIGTTPIQGTTAVRVRLMNGYQKSSTLYKANARAKEVEVRLLPSGRTARLALTNTLGWQELTVAQTAGPVEGVEIRVVSTYPGSKYTDLCISDVEVYATATTPDNPAAEKAKLDRLLAWKAARVEAARVFAASAKQHVPLAPAYTLEVASYVPEVPATFPCPEEELCSSEVMVDLLGKWPAEGGPPAMASALALATTAMTSDFAGWNPVQAVSADTRDIPPVEGLAKANLWNCYYEPAIYTDGAVVSGSIELPVPGKLGFLRSDAIGTFAVAKPPTLAKALEGKLDSCMAGEDSPATIAWALPAPAVSGAAPGVKALLLVNCGDIEAREGSDRVTHTQLLVYDDAGHLQLLVGPRYATAFAWRQASDGPVLSDAWRVSLDAYAIHARESSGVAQAK